MDYYLEITNRCVGCDNCRLICPENAVFLNKDKYIIETWTCTLCNACVLTCPVDSIKEKSSSDQ